MQNNQVARMSEPEMIDHIKFIAKDIFQNTRQRITPQKYPFSYHKYATPFDRKQESSFYQANQCLDRINSRLKHSKADQKKKIKNNIFQNIDQFLKANRRIDAQQSTPIAQKINQNVYSRFKQQAIHLRELVNANKNKQDEKQSREQIWNKFLKREGQRAKDRRNLYQHIKVVEQGRRNILSQSRRVNTLYETSPKRVESRFVNQDEQDFARIRYNTQALKMRIQSIEGSRSPKKEVKHGLVKTFQYVNK